MKLQFFSPVAVALLSIGLLVPARASGVIAFSSDRDGNSEIYAMNSDGSEPTRLTHDPGTDNLPALSPKGGVVVFEHQDVSPGQFTPNIYKVNIDGSGLTALTTDNVSTRPAISPDGSKVSFWSNENNQSGLCVMNIDGSGRTLLANVPVNTLGNVNYTPVFSPDGRKIAFNKHYDGTEDHVDATTLCTVNVDGTEFAELTSDQLYSIDPKWSHDGQKILFTRYASGSSFSQIYTMNADGSGQIPSGINSGANTADYSPDGKSVAFTSPLLRIATANLDGSDQRFLTPTTSFNITPSWSVGSIPHTTSAFSISDPNIQEGNSGQKDLVFTVTLQAKREGYRSVDYAIVGATAKQDVDFTTQNGTGQNGTLTFAPGETSKTITVSVLGDTLSEANELIYVNLSNPVDATLSKKRGIGTIIDDDPLPSLRISDSSVTEGDGGQRYATFNVDLSTVSGQTVKVNYQTEAGGSPRATPSVDYTPLPFGTLTFAPGKTHATLRVAILPDTQVEGNEQFVLGLSNPVNATLKDANGLGTILNDDQKAQISVSDASVSERGSGKTYLDFNLTLAAANNHEVTVKCSTEPAAPNPANPGTDYVSISNKLVTFSPGKTTVKVSVEVLPDNVLEPDETLRLVLSDPVNGEIAVRRGTGTIRDDEPTTFIVHGGSVKEGDGIGQPTLLHFTISLSTPRDFPVTAYYHTVDLGTNPATAGEDYVAIPTSSVTFAPGETSKEVDVQVTGDTHVESDETVGLKLILGSGGLIAGTEPGIGVISNDDTLPEMKVTDSQWSEGNSGTGDATISVLLVTPSSEVVTVNYTTQDGSATAGSDYVAQSGTLTFQPGETVKNIKIQIKGDTKVEGNEDFTVALSGAVGAKIIKDKGENVIVDDDSTPTTAAAVAAKGSGASS